MPSWEDLRQEVFSMATACRLPPQVKLPVVPQAVVRFSHLAQHPDANIAKLAETLETDSSLTTELLRHVNSSAVGLKQRISNVRQAISAVGIRRSRTLVLTAALKTALGGHTSSLLPAARFQADNLEKALFAREMARQFGWEFDLAYTGGILQDLLLPYFTSRNLAGYEQFAASRKRLDVFEAETLGWNHGVAAARLMHQWGFPNELVLGVFFHHDLDQILAHPQMRDSSMVAVAAAAALPDSLDQSPQGLHALMRLQDEYPEFQFLTAAVAVDTAMAEMAGGTSNRPALCDRLGAMAARHLEGERLDSIATQKHVGSYTLEEELGRGGMGMVFRARHDRLKRPAALKLLKLSSISPKAIEQFESEVQLTSVLTSPHTINVYDYGVTASGVFYYVMEYIDGYTLSQLVRESGPLPEARLIHFLLQACCSIGEAHDSGLIHRDLKPDNLMICRRGAMADYLKVLDFGLAKLIEDPAARQGAHGLSGTPLYMSPDAIINPAAVDGRSDIYSLGAVMYYLLTGEPVFTGKDVREILQQHVEARPIPPSVRSGRSVRPALEELVLQCLAKRPEDRPDSIPVLTERLNECRGTERWTQAQAARWWTDESSRRVRSTPETIEHAGASTWIVAADAVARQ